MISYLYSSSFPLTKTIEFYLSDPACHNKLLLILISDNQCSKHSNGCIFPDSLCKQFHKTYLCRPTNLYENEKNPLLYLIELVLLIDLANNNNLNKILYSRDPKLDCKLSQLYLFDLNRNIDHDNLFHQ